MKRMRFTESLGVLDMGAATDTQKELIFAEARKKDKKKDDEVIVAVYPTIEAIHAGLTRNKTFYPSEKLRGNAEIKSGVFSWLYPYRKPMLTHHNKHSGEPIGRVKSAKFAKETLAGKEGLVVVAEITDPDAMQKVLDKRYWTVSIGAETDSATCSICGANVVEEGFCGHEKGQTYDGKECYWIIGNVWFDELSFVTVPSDKNAQVVDVAVSGLDEFADSPHLFSLKESHRGNPLYVDGEATIYEQKMLDSGVKIDELYNVIQTFRSSGLSQDEIVSRWDEVLEAAKDDSGSNNTTKEVNQVIYKDLLAQVKALDEDALVEFLNKDTEDLVEIQVQMTLVKEAAEAVNTKVEELTTQVADLTTELETAKTQAEADKEANKGTITGLEEKITELEEGLANAEGENQNLLDENARLATELHKTLAERVIDLKVALNKPGIDKREEAISEHIARQADSLIDTLNDLLAEMSTAPVGIRPNRVTNPAEGAINDQKNSHGTAADKGTEGSTTPGIGDEDVLRKLFSGKTRKK